MYFTKTQTKRRHHKLDSNHRRGNNIRHNRPHTLFWDATTGTWTQSTALLNDNTNVSVSGNILTRAITSAIGSVSNFFNELYVKKIFDTSTTPSSGAIGQVLSVNDTTGEIEWIDSVFSTLQDTEGDTQIQVEEGADDDTIRFDILGLERATIQSTGETLLGNPQSLS